MMLKALSVSITPNEQIPCNLCGAQNFQLVYPSTLTRDTPTAQDFRCTSAAYGVHPPIVRCNGCGLVYANPRWASAVVQENYSVVQDPIYVQEREGRVLTFTRNLKPFEDLARASATRRLLDVGCHIGVMVELAQARGWEAWGVEPSTWAAEQARARGLNVITGTLAEAKLPENYFDVVTLWDVVEHLTDPRAELDQIHRVLKPGGILAVHTIDIESAFARVLGKRWPWLMEMHLYYFSPHTLGKMLQTLGFEIVRANPQGRFLRVGYLATRIAAYNPTLARWIHALAARLNLLEKAIPVNFGDLFTMHARKK